MQPPEVIEFGVDLGFLGTEEGVAGENSDPLGPHNTCTEGISHPEKPRTKRWTVMKGTVRWPREGPAQGDGKWRAPPPISLTVFPTHQRA